MTIPALILTLAATIGAEGGQSGLKILDFHASWCGPCQQMRPRIEQLIRSGYPVRSIDIDHDEATAQRYGVTEVPTFIIVDAQGHPLARKKGLTPASELANLYRQALAKFDAAAKAERARASRSEEPPADDRDEESTAPPKARVPRPWETVVRIRIPDNHHRFVGFGSGTIIHSTEEESIILTCAHIFHIEGASKQPPPAQFPRKIIVEWFDGKLTGLKPAMVHPAGKTVGEAIDYDFAHDVGLIRIRPGRKLPASPVVPPGWKPQVGQDMIAVGCSEGNDATAWSTKVSGGKTVESQGRRCAKVECTLAPKQGRSGGGLYTVDGYVAGVCDFADYGGNRGLYATPASIHHLLNRNQLAFLYDPNAKGPRALLASNRGGRTPSSSGTLKLRSQNPPAERTEEPPITLPDPSLLGIKVPSASSARSYPGSKNSMAWEPPSEEMSPSRVASDSLPRNQARKPVADDVDDPAEALTAGLKMSPSATEDHISLDDDDFPEAPAPERTTDQPKAKGSSGWEAVRPRTPAVSASQER